MEINRKSLACFFVSCVPGCENGATIGSFFAGPSVQPFQPACAADRIDATALSAAAGKTGDFIFCSRNRRNKGGVAPFASEASCADDQFAA